MNDIIRLESVAKTYTCGDISTAALHDISLSIPQGSYTCIVGPSGHGKSTLMHLVGGLDRPSRGSIAIAGAPIQDLSASALAALRGRRIGFVFQFFNLLQGLSAQENIEVAMMLAGRSEAEQRERARELLALVGLADKAAFRPWQLSGGQQQRVAIARALANDPEILLMDEPTGNLDSAAEAEILDLLDSLHRSGKTVIVVTHSSEVAARAERIVRVRDGGILADAEFS